MKEGFLNDFLMERITLRERVGLGGGVSTHHTPHTLTPVNSHVCTPANLLSLLSSIAAAPDHFTQMLHCEHECVRDLATRPGRLSPMENYLPLHYDYLQFAYYQGEWLNGHNEEEEVVETHPACSHNHTHTQAASQSAHHCIQVKPLSPNQ